MKRLAWLPLLAVAVALAACGPRSNSNTRGLAYPAQSASSASGAAGILLEALFCAGEFDVEDPYYVDGKAQTVWNVPESLLGSDAFLDKPLGEGSLGLPPGLLLPSED